MISGPRHHPAQNLHFHQLRCQFILLLGVEHDLPLWSGYSLHSSVDEIMDSTRMEVLCSVDWGDEETKYEADTFTVQLTNQSEQERD